jgi:hypothetical protein
MGNISCTEIKVTDGATVAGNWCSTAFSMMSSIINEKNCKKCGSKDIFSSIAENIFKENYDFLQKVKPLKMCFVNHMELTKYILSHCLRAFQKIWIWLSRYLFVYLHYNFESKYADSFIKGVHHARMGHILTRQTPKRKSSDCLNKAVQLRKRVFHVTDIGMVISERNNEMISYKSKNNEI